MQTRTGSRHATVLQCRCVASCVEHDFQEIPLPRRSHVLTPIPVFETFRDLRNMYQEKEQRLSRLSTRDVNLAENEDLGNVEAGFTTPLSSIPKCPMHHLNHNNYSKHAHVPKPFGRRNPSPSRIRRCYCKNEDPIGKQFFWLVIANAKTRAT